MRIVSLLPSATEMICALGVVYGLLAAYLLAYLSAAVIPL